MESIEDFSFRNTEKSIDAKMRVETVEMKPVKDVQKKGRSERLDRLFSLVEKNNTHTAKDIFQSDMGRR